MPRWFADFLDRMLNRLACDTADRAGAALGLLTFHLGLRRRHCAGMAELTLGLRGTRRRSVLRRAYASMGANFLAIFTVGGPHGLERCIAPWSPAHLARLRAMHQGMVVVTGHLGSWDAGGLACVQHLGRMIGYAKRQHDPALDDAVNRRRCLTGLEVLLARQGDRGSAVRVLRFLRDGGLVGLIADQRPRPEEGQAGTFLGQRAWLHPGPGFFAEKARRPLVLGATLRRRAGDLRFFLGRPFLPERGAAAATQRILDQLGQLIAQVPGQYFWHHKRFRDQPPAGTP